MKSLLLGVCLALLPHLVFASSQEGDTERVQPSVDGVEQARQCFRRGVDLYDEHDLGGAEVEFRRAYRLAKSFRILYNLAQVASEQHDYASALDLYRRYLLDGGAQILADRRRFVEDELARLRSRVGLLNIEYDESDVEVLLDDVSVGRTPLIIPLQVNVGRHRIGLRPRRGEIKVRSVDVAGDDTVVLRLESAGTGLDLRLQNSGRTSVETVGGQARPRTEHRRVGMWIAWGVTGVVAAGAGIAGVWAYQTSRDLKNLRQTYPVTRSELDAEQGRLHTASLITDGLLVGTAALVSVSLYLTLSRPAESKPLSQISVGWSWPATIDLHGSF